MSALRAMMAAALLAAACSRQSPPNAHGLDCVLPEDGTRVLCPVRNQRVFKLELSKASELVLTAVSAKRTPTHLVVDATLQGAFRNEADQNLYLFIGEPGAPDVYALTADPQYAKDLSYPVRTRAELPHRNEVRVGVMAPWPAGYSPQVYVMDPVRADAVGADSGVVQRVEGSTVHLEVPLARYYALKGTEVPRVLSVTVATARDYVGFVDQLSVPGLAVGDTRPAAPRGAEPPALYPSLDERSHRFRAVSLEEKKGTTSVSLKTAAPITDWGQTNLQVLFVPLPPRRPEGTLKDASHALPLPYAWSHYCAVYSPGRVFCKSSHGKDFTYDTAYAERTGLEGPTGVRFREERPGDYVLEVPTAALGRGPEGVAVLVLPGRDGFAPTTFFGLTAERP